MRLTNSSWGICSKSRNHDLIRSPVTFWKSFLNIVEWKVWLSVSVRHHNCCIYIYMYTYIYIHIDIMLVKYDLYIITYINEYVMTGSNQRIWTCSKSLRTLVPLIAKNILSRRKTKSTFFQNDVLSIRPTINIYIYTHYNFKLLK